MTLEESREIIPLMESMIGQIEEQQTLMAEMILEMQNRDTQLSLMQVSSMEHSFKAACKASTSSLCKQSTDFPFRPDAFIIGI